MALILDFVDFLFRKEIELTEVLSYLLGHFDYATDDVEKAISQGILPEDCLLREEEFDLGHICELLNQL